MKTEGFTSFGEMVQYDDIVLSAYCGALEKYIAKPQRIAITYRQPFDCRFEELAFNAITQHRKTANSMNKQRG